MWKRREFVGLAAGSLVFPFIRSGARADAGDMILGDPQAPIEIIEYASMTCGACAAFHANTLPDLKANWLETGRARLVFREYPLDGLALRVAALARCAGGDHFFPFIDVLFRTRDRWAGADDPVAELREIVASGGRDPAIVDHCINDRAVMQQILEGLEEARATHSVRATPTLVLNGEVVTGDPGYAALDAMLLDIEAAL
ncbi:MAG: thioredoxin domain-containing protein [bacterium]|nr:thioredoxin domain-containing protein [bacterium]MDE0241193.1 thioredoxin domain-containing protein [bacterium]MDE0415966.1 thioredoxin domain-containing protein [bacterium]